MGEEEEQEEQEEEEEDIVLSLEIFENKSVLHQKDKVSSKQALLVRQKWHRIPPPVSNALIFFLSLSPFAISFPMSSHSVDWSFLSFPPPTPNRVPHYPNVPLKFRSLQNDLLLSLHGNCPSNKLLASISIKLKKTIREIAVCGMDAHPPSHPLSPLLPPLLYLSHSSTGARKAK